MKQYKKMVLSVLLSYGYVWFVILYRISNVAEFNIPLLLFVSIAFPLFGYIWYKISEEVRAAKYKKEVLEKNDKLLLYIGPAILLMCLFFSFQFANEDGYVFLLFTLLTTLVFTKLLDKIFVYRCAS